MKSRYGHIVARKIWTVVILVLLCAAGTTAWFLTENIRKVSTLGLEYDKGSMSVASKDISLSIEATNPGQIVPGEGSLIQLQNIVPNDVIPFVIHINNNSHAKQTVKLYMDGIVSDSCDVGGATVNLHDYLYVSVRAGKGYSDTGDTSLNAPEQRFLCIGEEAVRASDGSYTMQIYSALEIPATGEDETVDLDCYFWLDKETPNPFMDSTATVGSLRIVWY